MSEGSRHARAAADSGPAVKTYRLVWWTTSILLALLGTAGAIVSWSVATALIIFGCAALMTTSVITSLTLPEDASLRELRTTATNTMLIAFATVALCGFVGILGVAALPVLAIMAAASPPAVAFCLTKLQPEARDHQSGVEPSVVAEPTVTTDGSGTPAASERMVEDLDDAALGRVWRASYWALRDASSTRERMQIVEARQGYLDELERRHQVAVARWLESEARPCGDPIKYLADSAGADEVPANHRQEVMADEAQALLVQLQDTDRTVAEEEADVRGRTAIDRDGQEIGEIDELLIDPDQRKVRFLQVTSGGFLGIGERTFLIPVDAVTGVDEDKVAVEQDREHVAGAPVYDPELEDKPDRGFYEGIYGYYGYAAYWQPGYRYPRFP